MKYEKCLNCSQLGKACDGPNLLAMETVELGQWCDELRKQRPGLTYDRIAAETGVSKTAVYGFLKGAHEDCNLHTARTVAKPITGGEWDNNPCGNLTNSEKAAFEEQIAKLQTSVTWHEDKLKHYQTTNESLQTLVTNTNARMTKDKEFLQEQIKSKNKVIAILASCLAVALLVIITALVIDRTNGDIGFFWLDGAFRPQGLMDGVSLIGKIK